MRTLNRCFVCLLVCNVAVVALVCLVMSWNRSPNIFVVEDSEPCRPPIRSDRSTRLILFWTPYFERADFGFGYGHEPFVSHGCPVNACETTSDRNRLSEADAVVFHIRDLDPYDVPTVRYTCQRWIFFLMETPFYTRLNLKPFRNFFNWTFTYRFDSDIPPRIQLTATNVTSEESVIDHASNKTGLVVWLVSNCNTFSHRERYVKELRKYIPVDVYGECGDHRKDDESCGRDTPLRHCYRSFEKRYKFYLAFENSLCRDYFSEKLYNIFEHDMVPVVLGKVDYDAFAPPHSLIDASDFASPAHLADFLRSLDWDDRAYDAYFDWKRRWKFSINTAPWCDVCAKLNDPLEPAKTYVDMDEWWVDGGNCTNDVAGSWTIASFWDSIVDSTSIEWGSLKRQAKLYVKNLQKSGDA